MCTLPTICFNLFSQCNTDIHCGGGFGRDPTSGPVGLGLSRICCDEIEYVARQYCLVNDSTISKLKKDTACGVKPNCIWQSASTSVTYTPTKCQASQATFTAGFCSGVTAKYGVCAADSNAANGVAAAVVLVRLKCKFLFELLCRAQHQVPNSSNQLFLPSSTAMHNSTLVN